MELYLQFGSGMMGLDLELAEHWGEIVAILSPRDLDSDQIVRHSLELKANGSSSMIDPQFFLPRADHHRLTAHEYWPEDFDTGDFGSAETDAMVGLLNDLNQMAECPMFIVPGRMADEVDDAWVNSQKMLKESVSAVAEIPTMTTLCLASGVVRNNDQVSLIMELEEHDPAAAYYLILETPGTAYLSDDPQWLSNALGLAAGLKRIGSKVVVGYANQQHLILALAGVDAIASGTWMNVRTFPPSKFTADEDEIRRRATWYYLPQALSEFKLTYLDIGIRLGLSDTLLPEPMTAFAKPLFDAAQPSASGWRESEAFRHYLDSLRLQVNDSQKESFEETVQHHLDLLATAESVLGSLHKNRITGENRDFGESIPAHRAALTVLERTQGPILKREWDEIMAG